jgi:hypothetical protein
MALSLPAMNHHIERPMNCPRLWSRTTTGRRATRLKRVGFTSPTYRAPR